MARQANRKEVCNNLFKSLIISFNFFKTGLRKIQIILWILESVLKLLLFSCKVRPIWIICKYFRFFATSKIAQNESLKVLKLGWNTIRLLGAASIITSLKENVSLKEIDLSWNGIDSRHSAELGNVLIANNTLLELNLNHNRIDQNGVANIARGLASNESLICLRINGNPIREDGFQAILQVP